MASGVISIMYGLTGPNLSLQTACATANHSIASGMMIIQKGMADMMVTGGAEGKGALYSTEHVHTQVLTALSNSFGFSGHNSNLVLRAV